MEALLLSAFLINWCYSSVPEDCPGADSENAGRGSACEGCPNQSICQSATPTVDPILEIIETSLAKVKHVVLILSGKGGVGKSTIASQLAFKLAENHKVGLLDVDICGPSIPRMTNTQNAEVFRSTDGWVPVEISDNLCVLSIGHLMDDPDAAVIWRGPKKNALIRQFLSSVAWGELDYLIIDTPPGTSDEHLSLMSYLPKQNLTGAILVSTPEHVAIEAVTKQINFCKTVGINIIGAIENMTRSVFDNQNKKLFAEMCNKHGIEACDKVDLSLKVVKATDAGAQCTGMQFTRVLELLNRYP